MAQLFDDVFNTSGIYDMRFFNCKTVLTYPTLDQLEKENKPMYERWLYQAKKFNKNYPEDTKATTVYEQNAIKYPEFSKIVAITYAKAFNEGGVIKRHVKRFANEDEFVVFSDLLDELYQISSDGTKSSPQYFPILCGHNILNHDIPLILKKCLQYNNRLTKGVPLIIKRSLGIKPWESGVIDTVDVWKFNGYDKMPLMLIADYLGLKKTVDLLPLDEVSKKYWALYEDKPAIALEFISLQSATQVNLVIQLINGLRKL